MAPRVAAPEPRPHRGTRAVRCPACRWYGRRAWSEEPPYWGVCRRCGTPVIESQDRVLAAIKRAERDFLELEREG